MHISLNKRSQSILIITGIFIILYFVMRFLPDSECGFLHYEEVVNENGEVEFCATNSAGFIGNKFNQGKGKDSSFYK